jgi:hypothetical protein
MSKQHRLFFLEVVMRQRWLPVICATFGAIWSAPILAHDIYSNVLDKYGALCCNQADCRPAHFRVMPQGLKMLIHTTWITVPTDLIQYRSLLGDDGETAGGHWCGTTDWDLGSRGEDPALRTFCAILPPKLASAPRD